MQDFARPDLHRELRQGIPEAVYGEGKTPAQVTAICESLMEGTTSPVIVTRVTPEQVDELLATWPSAVHHPTARLVVLRSSALAAPTGLITILSAGTSDLPVAEEAAVVAECLGAKVECINDVGVAGVHRLIEVQDSLHTSDVVIVVAGMEGALPSVVAGLTSKPVVAVPTSVGYGASFEGLAALLGMMSSCAPGVAVVNIDNGFGAALVADRIVRGGRP
jgi:NCAIR mutase (PurE)-related protein